MLVNVSVPAAAEGSVANTVKLEELVPVCPDTVTAIGPVVAPAGTVTVREVAELAEGVEAATPLKVTELLAAVALKLVPEMVTDVPTGPLVGTKPEMDGAVPEAPTRFSIIDTVLS